ncbi:ATPase-like, ATP-binding domain protein [Niveomyces insectorum RCEF 264]|uniref:ATPase-like, ATP-binding domain protein n=1 Tax=Niveomyces insectorum RCEF 264 TaxID=1081102 RepID=A0A167UK77_9HYPO|nr:ATPase-like, ATP-binding domain protein [Niveomyces insectorum RCEF 264]
MSSTSPPGNFPDPPATAASTSASATTQTIHAAGDATKTVHASDATKPTEATYATDDDATNLHHEHSLPMARVREVGSRPADAGTASTRPALAPAPAPTAARTASASTSESPLLSFVDLLEMDPRAAFVVSSVPSDGRSSLTAAETDAPTVSFVYCNPALTASPVLRDVVAGGPQAKHAALWAGISHGDGGRFLVTTPLPSVVHLGVVWTRTVVRGGDYIVISANEGSTEHNVAAVAAAGTPTIVTETATATVSPEFAPRETEATGTATATGTPELGAKEATLHLFPSERQRQPPTPPASAVFAPHDEDEASPGVESQSSLNPTPQTKTAEEGDREREKSRGAVYGENSLNDDDRDGHDGCIEDERAAPYIAQSGTETGAYISQFKALTDFMPTGMCVFDPAGNVTVANPAWHHIMGCPAWPAGSVMARDAFLSYIEDDDRAAVHDFLEEAVRLPDTTFGFRVKTHGGRNALAHSPAGLLDAPKLSSSLPTDSSASSKATTPMPTPTATSAPSQRPSPPPDVLPPARPSSSSLLPRSKSNASYEVVDNSAAQAWSTVPNQAAKRADASQARVPRGSHVLATAHAEKDRNGLLVRVLVCLRDITEHQSIAEAADRHAQQASNLKRMAEFATVGMYDIDIDGRLRGANRVFYEMCGFDKPDDDADPSREMIHPWMECVADEDQPYVQACLDRIVVEGNHQAAEVRFKKPWTTDDGAGNRIVAPRWIESTFLPVKNADGKVQSIMGCLSDVSLRRWQLERERQVKEEAIESKRQQENFVDITSHEIRNPLTVIMHCGEAMLECLTKIREDNTKDPSPATASAQQPQKEVLLDDSIDYAEIIVSSALHQKAIVDDILTTSKLDSELLAVTPVTVDPLDIVRTTLRMFEVQARQQKTALRMAVDPSYPSLGVPFLNVDPSRVKQILINLLTNALKFTRSAVVREVTTTVSVSHTRPTDATCSVAFVPRPERKPASGAANTGAGGMLSPHFSQSPSPASPTTPASPTGPAQPDAAAAAATSPGKQSVFLVFQVRDTGEGLTKEGMDTLFQKFVQVDSNTHIKHGGSGLGLFISRRLAEIQNGAIGVASKPGVGSTFAFYVEAFVPPPSAIPDVLSPGEAAKIALASSLGSISNNPGPGSLTPRTKNGESATTTQPNVADDPPDAYFSNAMGTGTHATSLTASMVPNAVSGTTDGTTDGTMEAVTTAIKASKSPKKAEAETTTEPADQETTVKPTVTAKPPTTAADRQLASVSSAPPEIRGVLLVEDNVVNQKVTRRYFEKCGFAVQVAANGIEALEKIRQSDRCVPGGYPISVTLMDMEMPVQDGLTCTRNIRALEAAGSLSGGRMPVLMITGNARPEQIADARAAGCDDVVVKPFQMHLLFEHIKLVMHTLWETDMRALDRDVKYDEERPDGCKHDHERKGDANEQERQSLPTAEEKTKETGVDACQSLDEGVSIGGPAAAE